MGTWAGALEGASGLARMIAVGAVVGLMACGGRPSPISPDAGMTRDAGPTGKLEVGTGLIAFEPFDGDTPAELIRGPQSGGRYDGHHVWISLRLTGVALEDLDTYQVEVLNADGELAASIIRDAARAPFELDEADRWILTGLAPRLSDCCLVEGRAFTVMAEVVDKDGGRLEALATALAGQCDAECP